MMKDDFLSVDAAMAGAALRVPVNPKDFLTLSKKPRMTIEELARIRRCQQAKAAGEPCREFEAPPSLPPEGQPG